MDPLEKYRYDLVAFAALFNVPLPNATQLTLRRVQAGVRTHFMFKTSRSQANHRSVLLTGIIGLWRTLCFDDDPFVGVFTCTEESARSWMMVLQAGTQNAEPLIRQRVEFSDDLIAARRVEEQDWVLAPVTTLEEMASGTDQYMSLAIIHDFDRLDREMMAAIEHWADRPGRLILATDPSS